MIENIKYPSYWIPNWRVSRALVGYPLYDVPHKRRERDLPKALAQENFDYFMRLRLDRLSFFSKWLHEHFRVDSSLTPAGVTNVSRWVDKFGGGIIEANAKTYSIFGSYSMPWEGKNAGYNVIVDLGVFIGEYLINRQPRLYWEMYEGHGDDSATFHIIDFRRPVISGLPHGWRGQALNLAFGIIVDRNKAIKIGHERTLENANAIINQIRSLLHMARTPDDIKFIGDSSNEPL